MALAEIYLSETDRELDAGRLEEIFVAAIERAREAWPQIEMPGETLVRFVSNIEPFEDDVEAWLEQLPFEDLWLVCGALAKNETAVAALHALQADVARTALPGTRIDEAAQSDVMQKVQARLLVGTPSSPPALESYKGRGALRSWLRVSLVREALRHRKKSDSEEPFEEGVLKTLAIEAADPEMRFLKEHYVKAFKAAFTQALGNLETRDRNILRYVVLESLAVEEIGALYGVNRTTVWRWMTAIRQSLLKRTRSTLKENLRVDETELDSIMRLIQSRLTATFSALGAVPSEE